MCYRSLRLAVLAILVTYGALETTLRAQEPVFVRQGEVIYGRKHGLAMTMDVFRPGTGGNETGVIAVVSGGWFSSQDAIKSNPGELPGAFRSQLAELLARGYTVFAVVHGSQPKYTIPEIREDLHRSVRFIRHHAERFGIGKENIGIFGGSAGGHLSLMQGTAGTAGDENAEDPVNRESSRVQAVVSYFPPTDFLNYGAVNGDFDKYVRDLLGGSNPFLAALDFREYSDELRLYTKVEGEKANRQRLAENAPVNHVSKDDPPTLIFHGDADKLVPIQQAHLMMERLKAAGVKASLKTMAGKAHGWIPDREEVVIFADWFDTHLRSSGDDE